MAKQQERISARQINDHGRKGHEVERVMTTDDYPLPEAHELERLKQIDPKIISWILERADSEQKHRHLMNCDRVKITRKAVNGESAINIIGQLLGFFIVAGGLYFSYTLILAGHNLFGSIFTGATLLAAAALFVPKRQK